MGVPHGTDLGSGSVDPVQRLLHMGEPEGQADGDIPADWPDYVAEFGITHAHVDALVRVACDPELFEPDTDSQAAWAPVHAWRALGQLRAQAAIAPLLEFLPTFDEDEAAVLELPDVFALIGPVAVQPIAAHLADPANAGGPASIPIAALGQIAIAHPDCRETCVDHLVRLLASSAFDPTDRGVVVSALLDLRAVEAIEPMRDAFQRDAVDISIAGDIEDVEIELGLRDRRATKKPRYVVFSDLDEEPSPVMVPVRSEKIGRNAPCPCGSGRKYKKCCLP